MANAQIDTGRLTEIFHPIGIFDNGERRYKRANYDLLEWASVAGRKMETFVVPLGFERITDADLNDFDHLSDEAIDVGQEFGFYTGDRIIVEPHQSDGSDSWIGLQFFGYI